MSDAETFAEQSVLGVDHVGVIVLREFDLQSVGGFGGFAVAYGVGNDDVILGRIERLTRAVQRAGEGGREHRCRRSAAAVQHEHRLAGRITHRCVMDAQFRHHVASVKLEVARDPVAFLGRRIVCRDSRK